MRTDTCNSGDDSFERAASTLLDALPQSMHDYVVPLIHETPMDVAELYSSVTAHIADIQDKAQLFEFIDIDTGLMVALHCRELLNGITSTTSREHRQLIQVAARYFIQNEDADSDMSSIVGFDDDALVVDTVARIVGRTDLPHLLR